ncbi:hypothetical protein [Okeania sp. SIO1I7]|uniref:hypothetical protein n=1 Tax=Okeania sp. SIO1I7 TaxID=2607772 RepID=UPI0013FC90AF|nr:hypothetical protein [Okeania sp. SIO1I7]NET27278.1 hypothetical protein [Okeania sp. SIO1I7]
MKFLSPQKTGKKSVVSKRRSLNFRQYLLTSRKSKYFAKSFWQIFGYLYIEVKFLSLRKLAKSRR